ncbi:SpoIIE family protein phosphatase [Pseudoalteromonas aurantia]|uniref:Fused response regulator/phosphatase n=1 Tax=Pseudoalteromonas aurantia TaxID=43654 RepID=A0A5S3VDW9_9GAMM|nr:SpoIIE family protein phosphatase [Pseudoalteromonas aurantia]TMO65222.1 fused response regulator/phosphatase [Pseudoalteromonas aurantia]TMO70512.1 fused response regulator/phosphatase [Pseudoalteromonas aurantia]TMO77622.1 fused response regulator/phosphatase [Pseudoalteromonas aurantia]
MRILVVDDQPLNCTLLKAMLEQQSYHVEVANDGRQALDVLQSTDIDIVLLDVMMPVMDGFEAAPKIKQLAGDVYLPVIFITALEDHASFEKCLAVGGDDFIHKPFDRIILSAKIKAHTRTRKLSQEAHLQKKQLEYYYNQTEREHEIVEHIFSNALSQQVTFPHHCDFHLSPASMFNGDMFLMAQSPMGGFYCLLGDFTGHGLAAAIGALPASRVFYTMVNKGMAVNDIAFELNNVLYNLLPGHMFCAAAIVELSESGKSISAWLGGLPDCYLIDQEGQLLRTLESQHMALGILDEEEFERNLIHLEVKPDQRLVMATDGIIETESQQGEMFGEELLKTTLSSTTLITTSDIIDKVHTFSEHGEQQDDLSIVIINCIASEAHRLEEPIYSSLPFNFSMSLNSNQMKGTDPILELVDVLSQIEGINEHRSNIFLLLSEAYNNSLDHGVLGLDSKIKNQEDGFFEFYQLRERALANLNDALIIISARYCPDSLCLYFSICDSGNGFRNKKSSSTELLREYGRGLSLLTEIAQSIKYNHTGNEVEMVYALQ